jgi:hypothetical protein
MFVIKWATYGYVTKKQTKHKPYTQTKADLDIRTWKTKEAAQRWLATKDSQWASSCVIEPL